MLIKIQCTVSTNLYVLFKLEPIVDAEEPLPLKVQGGFEDLVYTIDVQVGCKPFTLTPIQEFLFRFLTHSLSILDSVLMPLSEGRVRRVGHFDFRR